MVRIQRVQIMLRSQVRRYLAILGGIINHISEVVKGVKKHLYFLCPQVKSEELLLFYVTRIRPVTKYACPVHRHSLPQFLEVDLERSQRRALRIVFSICPQSFCKQARKRFAKAKVRFYNFLPIDQKQDFSDSKYSKPLLIRRLRGPQKVSELTGCLY